MPWRDVLLAQARTRIQSWYTDPSLTEAPRTRDGVTLRMLKKNMPCGGDLVPVTFAEFDVAGVRPVDVFNTMLDTPQQKNWNSQCSSVKPLGDWLNQGARAWAVTFTIPFVDKREFLQWQVADADVGKEEFWLTFSTQSNDELRKKAPITDGTVSAQNCLGAYHITKSPHGAHVVVTQQVNVHPFIPIPMHQVLDLFPAAWQGTIDFINQMSHQARQLAASGSSANYTAAPAFMLREADMRPSVQEHTVPNFLQAFPKSDPATPEEQARPRLSPLQCAALALLAPTAVILAVTMGFGIGRCATRKFKGLSHQGSAHDDEEPADHDELAGIFDLDTCDVQCDREAFKVLM